ncbi:UDP-glucosyltransferase 2-like isoform X2 [Diabrotica virgifera virgifera]|uniref:UDP-glucuronosyltransferase n=1 Tax=Diabrotica virgifera virgifera TaxID=50390 RepID=A0ABM5KDT7_DIAVI|nr:UDP-glucosyltransferase 2-like isoform X2 [Diabrotica virgifera virgifera]
MKIFLAILTFWAIQKFGSTYNILGVFTFCQHSHFTLGFQLLKSLADSGHNVTMISCFPQQKPIKNWVDISVRVGTNQDQVLGILARGPELQTMTHWTKLNFMAALGETYSSATFEVKAVQALLKSNQKFDVVIQENFLNEAFAIFHHKFNCPSIMFVPTPTTFFSNYIVANPWSPAFIPSIIGEYSAEMNFWQRLRNTFEQVLGEYFIHHTEIPIQNKVLKKYVKGAPDLRSILYNTSLLLISSHVSFIDPIPLQQNVIPIGGFHVTPPEPLPKKIKHFLDTAPHGVILFSMGSNKGITFNVRQKKDMLKVFAKLSQKVICNVDFASIETPENVLVADWLPQKDILAHPNTVAFISHGGLLGTTEAVYFGVPILGIPVYWDQAKNIEEVVAKGFAVRLDAEDIDEQTFEASLKRLINDPSYRRNAKERSQILRDQSVNQRDQAVFWVEYVIRHKGAHHLKSAALKLKWYQRYLLDIILFVTVASVFIIFAIYYCIKLLASIKNQTKLKDKVY